MPRAGRMNCRVTVQQPTETQDSFGEPDVTWSTYATRWAAIEYTSGAENFAAGADRSRSLAEIRMHHDSLTSAITAKMRVVYGSTTFAILSVENVNERGAEVLLRAEVRG